jgi:L-ribulose-5-phosphate 3-epimerase
MNLLGHDIGVCSWSLRPADTADLIDKVQSLRLTHVQLALGDLLALDDDARGAAIAQLLDSGLKITATMISYPGENYSSIASIRRTGGLVPDERWEERQTLLIRAAELSKVLGVTQLTTHVGFIPAPNDANYQTLVDRICSIAKPLAEAGLELLMETGQESASELLQFLNNCRSKNFGVNFDPANLILYGSGDPIEALKTLGRHVRHVHVKDAIRSKSPGIEWGQEVPFGDGQVPHDGFIRALRQINYTGPLVIEREAGSDRTADVRYAIETLQGLS